MRRHQQLLSLLADGHFHSGAALGRALGVGRTTVWQLVRALQARGLEVFAVPGKGYRLAQPVELLGRERVLAALDPATRALLCELVVLPEVDSTNRYLLAGARRGLAGGCACLAEHQSAGRGRRGRGWVSPLGANVYLSVLWRFDGMPGGPQALSLAMGVATANALLELGAHDLGLKWPNDLVVQGRKAGGLLLEMEGESSGPWAVVVGVGLNVGTPPAAAVGIDQPWADLRTAGLEASRNRVAGRVLNHLLVALARYAREGFVPFRARWDRLDVVRGHPVRVEAGAQVTEGLARGVDETGALLLAAGGEVRRIVSGEASLRVAG
ncbi:MAG: biotin--[acetyl-CoA-carboxylase] ligase [Gammaproteobacteria bacterium]|nr:biotin--[acetyl-CoA-carboxylase] ligase [Gammaproteobacteria bacterium]NIR82051.1 biotin--[acetyl-CoA-carboxylase] ligase [Gammaproteobacteria bacterium]NIR89279.1 biotin--[acetyl-CoA-carboxylase] ligase [Gammaproteobacteria bacterium]NIU03161.1 biotin--[acetyl-CoA-carboxylase] ligase [Gammaproteobacteria bacterium]NIV50677.1 biotin--[acetyl-CoA-carboxylase] ligase [Gammaproteobacteria bacterium]